MRCLLIEDDPKLRDYIARRHGGALELGEGLAGNNRGGLRAIVRLPSPAPPRAAA